jgi:hypothetical protein
MHPKQKMATPATVSTKQGLNPAPPSIAPCVTTIDWQKSASVSNDHQQRQVQERHHIYQKVRTW